MQGRNTTHAAWKGGLPARNWYTMQPSAHRSELGPWPNNYVTLKPSAICSYFLPLVCNFLLQQFWRHILGCANKWVSFLYIGQAGPVSNALTSRVSNSLINSCCTGYNQSTTHESLANQSTCTVKRSDIFTQEARCLPSSSLLNILAVPKSVIWMCMSTPRRIFSGLRSLHGDKQHY